MSLAISDHSVTFHPTQVNIPRRNPGQTGWYSIYLPRRDGRLSCPRQLVIYGDGLSARRRSPFQILIRQRTSPPPPCATLIHRHQTSEFF